MKKFFITSKMMSMLLVLTMTFSIVSCSKDDDNDNGNNQPESIATIAGKTTNLSILVRALVKADLAAILSSPGTYTVFAPTDAAFERFLTANSYANIDAVPTAALKEILLNHVISTKNVAADLSTMYLKTLAKGSASSTNTLSLYVNKTGANVRLNGVSSVVTADIQASNGVIHIVDAVIDLPTVVTFAASNADFSTLVSLLNRDMQPNFVEVLSGAGPFTVFAPTNAAFTALDTELAEGGGIAGVSAENITKVLQYHVVGNANVLSTTLTEGQRVTPILTPAQTFTIGLMGGAKITDNSASRRVSNIVATDVQASNGVIHVIDKVLLPVLN